MSPVEETSAKLENLPPDRLAVISGLVDGWLGMLDGRPPITEGTARAIVNDWILQVLPDRFVAVEVQPIAGGDIWCVSVGLAYPQIGVIGQVGEVLISAVSGGIISATAPDAMKTAGMKCYADREDEIKSAFLSTRNAS
jgi:hypothetical protein